jgi:membrane protease YdiL (CAAX protease family)
MAIIDLLMLRQYRQHGPTPGSAPTFTQLTDLVPQIVVLAAYVVPAAIFMLISRERLASVGITTRSLWQAVLIGLGLALLTFYFQPGGFWAKIGKAHAQHAIAFVFYAFVGFGEEFLFRGYLQTRLVAWLGAWQGWVLASVSMALVHYPHRWLIEGQSAGAAAVSSLALVPVSLLMGFVMLRTGNIVAPGLFHTFANWVNTLR